MESFYKIDVDKLFKSKPSEVIRFLNNASSMDAYAYLEFYSYFIEAGKDESVTEYELGMIAYALNRMNVTCNSTSEIINKDLAARCVGRKLMLEDYLKTNSVIRKKAENVATYYALCNKLKHVVRTGWKDWKVNRDRLESVAEHIYGVQMLAIAMKSEYQYDIDLSKVLMMLAVHELEEILIGDLTLFQISSEEKEAMGHAAIEQVLSSLIDKEQIKGLIHEFDARKNEEAKFAYWCDKLECDLQCKIYDEEGCVDLSNQEDSNAFKNEEVQELLKEGKTWSDMWLTFGQRRYNYDQYFTAVSDFAKENEIHKLVKNI